MIKPLWALAGLALLGTAGVAGAIVIASPGGEEEVVSQVDTATPAVSASAAPSTTPEAALGTPSPAGIPVRTPAAGETLWRWVDVTILVPDDGRFNVGQDSHPAEAGAPKSGPYLFLARVNRDGPGYEPSSWVMIDAETGAILDQKVSEQDRDEVQSVLDTLVVSPLNVSTAPWPYNGQPPESLPRHTFGGLSFIAPGPETGLSVHTQINDPGGPAVGVFNGRTGVGVYVDAASGKLLVNTEYLPPEYEAVLMRWVEFVKICGVEVSC
jgi:hypothetical protein